MKLTAPGQRGRPPWRLLLVALLAFALGWTAALSWSALAPLRLTEHLVGTVAVVNEAGAKVCVEPDGGGGLRCGVAYRRPDAPLLRVGDRVTIAIGRLRLGGGNEAEVFVIPSLESDGSSAARERGLGR